MNREILRYCTMIGIRWAARIYGGLLAALILTIAIGESFFYPGDGLPNPFTQPLPVAIELFGMLTILAGCIAGWKWLGLGAVLVIAGIMTFHVIERKLLLMGALPLVDLAGILYLLAWVLEIMRRNGKAKKA